MITATYVDHMGDDLRTSNSARVSFKKKREEFLFEGDPRVRPTGRSDEQLIKDLAEEGHIAPFGHSYILFHIKAPIFVARQLVKHKFLRWSEVSRRYVDEKPEFYEPDVWRGQAKEKKQGSEGEVELYNIFDARNPSFLVGETFTHYQKLQRELYNSLLDAGVAFEQARMILPQNMLTEWYWSGSLDAFANMCNLRLKEDTQYETRLVAQQIDEMMQGLYPVSWKALVHHG